MRLSQKIELSVIPNKVRNLMFDNQQLIFSLLYELFIKKPFETASFNQEQKRRSNHSYKQSLSTLGK